MTTLGVFIATEIPVCSVALFATAGWVYRAGREHRTRQDAALSAQTQALAVLVAEVKPLVKDVDRLDTRTATLEQSTSALLATISAWQTYGLAPRPHPSPFTPTGPGA